MQNNVNSNIAWYEGHTITSLVKILKFSKFYVQNIWQVVRWWHHQLTHLHIHIDWSRNVLWKFAKTSKCHNFLIFQPIFIRISLLCLNIFTLSSVIKLNLLWSSPLKKFWKWWSPERQNPPKNLKWCMLLNGFFGNYLWKWYAPERKFRAESGGLSRGTYPICIHYGSIPPHFQTHKNQYI